MKNNSNKNKKVIIENLNFVVQQQPKVVLVQSNSNEKRMQKEWISQRKAGFSGKSTCERYGVLPFSGDERYEKVEDPVNKEQFEAELEILQRPNWASRPFDFDKKLSVEEVNKSTMEFISDQGKKEQEFVSLNFVKVLEYQESEPVDGYEVQKDQEEQMQRRPYQPNVQGSSFTERASQVQADAVFYGRFLRSQEVVRACLQGLTRNNKRQEVLEELAILEKSHGFECVKLVYQSQEEADFQENRQTRQDEMPSGGSFLENYFSHMSAPVKTFAFRDLCSISEMYVGIPEDCKEAFTSDDFDTRQSGMFVILQQQVELSQKAYGPVKGLKKVESFQETGQWTNEKVVQSEEAKEKCLSLQKSKGSIYVKEKLYESQEIPFTYEGRVYYARNLSVQAQIAFELTGEKYSSFGTVEEVHYKQISVLVFLQGEELYGLQRHELGKEQSKFSVSYDQGFARREIVDKKKQEGDAQQAEVQEGLKERSVEDQEYWERMMQDEAFGQAESCKYSEAQGTEKYEEVYVTEEQLHAQTGVLLDRAEDQEIWYRRPYSGFVQRNAVYGPGNYEEPYESEEVSDYNPEELSKLVSDQKTKEGKEQDEQASKYLDKEDPVWHQGEGRFNEEEFQRCLRKHQKKKAREEEKEVEEQDLVLSDKEQQDQFRRQKEQGSVSESQFSDYEYYIKKLEEEHSVVLSDEKIDEQVGAQSKQAHKAAKIQSKKYKAFQEKDK